MLRVALSLILNLSMAANAVAADWEMLPSMPSARSEMSAAAWSDLIYVPGGLGGMRRFEAYDTQSNEWLLLPDLPDGRHHVAVAAYDGAIYVFGGADSGWRASASSYVYDISQSKWRQAAPMPAPRYAAAAVVLGEYIYVVGGDGPGGHLLRYDPAGDSWRSFAPNLQRREHTSAVAWQGRILAVGGRWSGVGELKSTEAFDPKTGAWSGEPRLNIARGGFTAVNHAGRVLAFGGEVMMRGSQTLRSVERLDAEGWVQVAPLPRALHGVPVASHGDHVYVLGGSQRAGAIVNDGASFRSADY